MDKVDIENYEKELPQPNISKNNSEEKSDVLDPDDIWKVVKEQLRIKIKDRAFKTWFNNAYIEDISNGVVEFSCENSIQKDAILREYIQTFKECLSNTTGLNFMININTREDADAKKPKSKPKYEYYSNGENQNSDTLSKDLFTDLANEKALREKAVQKAQLNPKYTFNNFVVGSHNRLAEAVARASVEELGTLYNPVFFYGNTGVGKTHLMQAMGNKVIEKDTQKEVVYVSIEQFLNEMITSIRSKKEQQFREKYRQVDLLIIDDIQFVESYPKTQEALFHTFNTLYQSNKQIVLAADRPPSEIRNLTDRLRSRFEGGMVADIGVPDYETRMAILQQAVADKNMKIPNEYLDLIAKNIESNVRELEGALNKIMSLARLDDIPSLEEAAKILQVDIESKRKKITPKKILDTVSEVFEVKISEIKGNRRTAYVALSRQVVMYLLRTELEMPLEKVARQVNRKDHTTVLHACEKIEGMMKEDSKFDDKIENCRQELFK